MSQQQALLSPGTEDFDKPSRFAGRKKRRSGKRGRSDGFVFSLDLANSSDEDGDDGGRKSGYDSESLNFIFWLRSPTFQNLAHLRKAIRCNDFDWMRSFLEFDGLGLLFQCLKNFSDYHISHISDVVLRLACVCCIRELVNSRNGLDGLLLIGDRNDNLFGRRFASAMESNNVMVKTQIFELLSALCVYSNDGFYLTLDALDRYKIWKKQRYRFSLLVNELYDTDLTSYKATVMALVNSIIVASENIRDRVRIRNEFVALNILNAISCLRLENDADLQVQLDVFEEELSADAEAMVESSKESIDINNHLDLFRAVYNKVNGSTLSLSLLSVLYSLYQIDPNSSQSESTWILVEKLTQQAVEGALSADQLMEEAKTQRRFIDASVQTLESNPLNAGGPRNIRRSVVLSGRRSDPLDVRSVSPSPVSPTAIFSAAPPGGPPLTAVPPPPPPPPPLPSATTIPPRAPLVSSPGLSPQIPPPPPLAPGPGFPSPVNACPEVNLIMTPEPSCKLKSFTWNKVPPSQVTKNSIWDEVSKMEDTIQVEYKKLEELFAHKVIKSDTRNDEKVILRIPPSLSEVSLLDPKRSMNVNIYLKQFRKSNSSIVEHIRKGEAHSFGVEKIKGLIKILPQVDEVELIQNYDGDPEKLGNAEKFFLTLMTVPCYDLRLELMLAKSDFQSQLSSVRSNLLLLTNICRSLYDNKGLKTFLRLVLHAGNFINKGSNAGDAVGFRISSLNKLSLTKSNDPKKSLLHVLVEEAEAKDQTALEFVDKMQDDLHKTSRFSLETLKSEFSQIKNTIKKLQAQLAACSDEEIKAQFGEFLEEADGDLYDVDQTLEHLSKQTVRLADRYCEHPNSFHLEEFLAAFREFCDRVRTSQQDLTSWRQQVEKAEMRKKAHEELLEKRKSAHKDLEIVADFRKTPGHIPPRNTRTVDSLVNEIRRGNVLRRLSSRRSAKPNSQMESHL